MDNMHTVNAAKMKNRQRKARRFCWVDIINVVAHGEMVKSPCCTAVYNISVTLTKCVHSLNIHTYMQILENLEGVTGKIRMSISDFSFHSFNLLMHETDTKS